MSLADDTDRTDFLD